VTLGRNNRGPAEYEKVRDRVNRNGHNALDQVGTLGPVGGGVSAKVAESVAS